MKNYDALDKWTVILLQSNAHQHQGTNENEIEQYSDMIGDVKMFDCPNTCVDFLTDLPEGKICLILTKSDANTLLPLIHNIAQLKLVYTLGDRGDDGTLRKNRWTKFKGSFSSVNDILQHFKQDIRKSEYDLISISTVSSSTTDNLNELDPSFMYSQLLKDIVLQMQYNRNSKSDFVDYLRGQYANNSIDLKSVNTFDKTYSDKSPLWWYTKEVFIYGPLNRALRTQQTDTIVRMGFYIQDLHREIERLHKTQQNHRKMFVYRGQALVKNDFEKLQKNQGGLISFNNFLSTSVDEDVSHLLAESSASQEDSVGILFRIEIDPSISAVPFASIEEFSNHTTEKEFLFSMQTICRIGTIENIGEAVWQVNLTLTDDNDEQLKRITESIRKQVQNSSASRSLGYLLYRMGEYENAERTFKKILASTREDDISSRLYLYEILGDIAHDRSDYPTALSYFQKILDMYPLPDECSSNFDQSTVYMNMASIYHSMGDFSTAAEFHELVIEIREESIASYSLRDFGTMYNNVALTYTSTGRYTDALKYFQKSLDYLQRSLPPFHPDLSFIYNNIGMINCLMGERETALQYHEKALQILRKSLPSNHVFIATTLSNVAAAYQWIGQYQTAIEHFKSSLTMMEGTSFCEHPDFAVIHNNIGQLYKTCSEYNKALPHFLKAIEVQKAISPADDLKLALYYINIGLLYKLMGDLPMAMEYIEKANQIQERSTLPEKHPDRARTYNAFGVVYQAKQDYWIALDYYQKAIDVQEAALPPTHPDLASIYNNIADVEIHLGHENAALDYIKKTLRILHAHLQSDHPDIGRTYLNMGTIYMRMSNYDKTKECFDKTFKIYKLLPEKDYNVGVFYANVSQLNCVMGNFPKALKHLEKARNIFQAVLPPGHPHLVSLQETISRVRAQMSSFGGMPQYY